MEKKRIGWIDSVRFLAIFWVMTTHYISLYHKQWLVYWEEGPTRFFLQGLTGKFAVAIFCLLMGYFVAAKCKSGIKLHVYLIDRYLQFSQGVFFMNAGLALGIRTLYHFDIVNLGFRPDAHSVRGVLRDSFLFESEVILPFWCIEVFFVSSILLAVIYVILKKIQKMQRQAEQGQIGLELTDVWQKFFPLLLLFGVVFCIYKGYIWVGLCILGAVLYEVVEAVPEDWHFLRNPWLHALVLFVSFTMIQRKESDLTFVIYGISGFLILFVLFHNTWLQKLLDRKPLRFLGNLSFSFYLVHIPIQTIVSFYIYLYLMKVLPLDIAFVLSYLLTVPIDILAAWIYHIFLRKWIQLLKNVLYFKN